MKNFNSSPQQMPYSRRYNNVQEINPNTFEQDLLIDRKTKSHNRRQLIENAKTELTMTCLNHSPKVVVVLAVGWVLSCIFNAYEIKNGIEKLFEIFISMVIGAFIGKYII